METYLVGGAVRDKLFGLEVRERDWVVVGATPEEMRARGFRSVGKEFPVFLHPETKEEYALARTERKVGPGYTGFEFHADPEVTLEEDLRRRDLTINAMAETAEGELIDPFNGQDDLRAGVLRHVSAAFAEDPVRILRVARLAARFARWGFHVAHSTNKLMRTMVENGEVDALVPERVWAELEKGLAEDAPTRFFTVLRGCGALARLFPEIDALFEATGTEAHGDKDEIHAMRALQQAVFLSPEPRVRFAALAISIGKEGVNDDAWPGGADPERAAALVRGLCERFRLPNEYRELAVSAVRNHVRCHAALDATAPELLDLLEALDAFRRPERFGEALLACQADARAATDHEYDPYPQAKHLRGAFATAAAVDAGALIDKGLKGKEIGEALRRERITAIENALVGGFKVFF